MSDILQNFQESDFKITIHIRFMYLTHLRTAPGGEKMKYFALWSMQADSLHAYGHIPVPNLFLVKMSLRHFVHVTIDIILLTRSSLILPNSRTNPPIPA